MTTTKFVAVILQNVKRNRKNFIFSTIGITIGVSVFSFFIALTMGVREEILNKIYPVDLIEIEPASVSIGGARSSVSRIPLDIDGVKQLEQVDGVDTVYPKLRSKFQAIYRMSVQLAEGGDVNFEAFFDGIDDTLLTQELKEREKKRSTSTIDRLHATYGRPRKCYVSEDCSPGEFCKDSACRSAEYWSMFRDRGEVVPCSDNSVCASGYSCVHGQCRITCPDGSCLEGSSCFALPCQNDANCNSGSCSSGACSVATCNYQCRRDDDCNLGSHCVPGACQTDVDCTSGPCVQGTCLLAGTCQAIPCVQSAMESAIDQNMDLRRGERPGLCEDGTPIVDGQTDCPKARCPYGTYCSVSRYFEPDPVLFRDKRGEGFCEQPIPVVLNPVVLEVFNLVLESSLDLGELGSPEALLGYEGSITYGKSYYNKQTKDRTPVEKRLVIVGFSSKSLEAGVTMPMEYVKRANARYKGSESNADFDSVILHLADAENLPPVMKSIEQANLQLSRRSADADKFRTILQVAIAIFMIMASIILGIAAINITHTFLMVIYERKREIGILRALGATKNDIRGMFLGESVLIGFAGALIGNSIAYGMSRIADYLATQYLSDFPFEPTSFFFFKPDAIALSFGFAVFFSLLGAFFPANRAAAMDPAETLTLA